MVNTKYYQHFWSPIKECDPKFKTGLLDGSPEYEIPGPLKELIIKGHFNSLDKVEWITGGFDLGDISDFSIPSNFDIYHWPTFFFTHGLSHLETFRWWDTIEENITNPKEVTHKFISYNRKPHDYRCLLIDKLAQFKLIESNLVSWQQLTDNFKFNFFDQKILVIDQPNPDEDDMREMHAYAPQHVNAFMQLISESNINQPIFITEKTVKALAFGDIFLTFGPRGYYSKLKELGFELYTEIFNYDFDLKDSHTRLQSIINNIRRLPESKETLRVIKKNLIDKRLFNQHKALEIGRFVDPISKPTLDMLKRNYEYFPKDDATHRSLEYLNLWNQNIFYKTI